MGFFRKKKDAPLSSTMYQGDNSTPARGGGKSTPLTPDTVPDAAAAITTTGTDAKKKGLLFGKKKKGQKTKERYVKVTPDKKDHATDDREQVQMMMPPPEKEQTASFAQGTDTGAARDANHETQHSNSPTSIIPDQFNTLDEEMEESKRNLNAVFTQDDDDFDPLDKENKKFLNRFRTSWRKSSNRTNIEQKAMAQKLIERQQKNKEGTNNNTTTTTSSSPVPKLIDHSDGASVPSLITEMTGHDSLKRMKSTEGGMSVTPNEMQSAAITQGNGGAAATATTATTQMQSFFGPPDSFSRQPRQELTLGEKFLSLLQCGHDDTTTTSDNEYFGRIKCLDLCGPLMGEKDGLRLEQEKEDKFVIQFMNVSYIYIYT